MPLIDGAKTPLPRAGRGRYYEASIPIRRGDELVY